MNSKIKNLKATLNKHQRISDNNGLFLIIYKTGDTVTHTPLLKNETP